MLKVVASSSACCNKGSYYHCIWLLILYEKCWNTDTRHLHGGELPIHSYYILVTLRFMALEYLRQSITASIIVHSHNILPRVTGY